VTMPVYNTEIVTNDRFKKDSKFYQHVGRSDIAKINGNIFDLQLINGLNSKNPQANILLDSIKNSIYLIFWNSKDEQLESYYVNFFKHMFNGAKIDKTAILDRSSFESGVKIDNELLREYFRNYV